MKKKVIRRNRYIIVLTVVPIAAALACYCYYQFIYLPQANYWQRVLHPSQKVPVTIVNGSWSRSQSQHFVPTLVQTQLGYDNEIIWTNNDAMPHTVLSDDKYVDQISGPFDTTQQRNALPTGYILPGKAFDFTFTEPGQYHYGCLLHPFMQGIVAVKAAASQ